NSSGKSCGSSSSSSNSSNQHTFKYIPSALMRHYSTNNCPYNHCCNYELSTWIEIILRIIFNVYKFINMGCWHLNLTRMWVFLHESTNFRNVVTCPIVHHP